MWNTYTNQKASKSVSKLERNLHDVAACLAVGVNAVDGCKDELLLQMTQSHDVFLGFLRLYLRISRDDTETCAGSI